MPASDFNDHVAALVARILEKPKKLVTESLKYWAEILTEQLQFKRRKKYLSGCKCVILCWS